MSDLCEKQTMPLVSAFMRDTHLTKPQDCLEGDGVGFQEHMCLNLWNVHIEETMPPCAIHKFCSVTLSLIPFSRFLTTNM